MWKYIFIELAVLALLVFFVLAMLYVSRRWIWPQQTEQPPPYVGALVSSAGTIFAASIAWAIADSSIEYQKQVAKNAAEHQAQTDLKTKKEVLELSAEMNRQLSEFLTQFPTDDAASGYSNKLLNTTIPGLYGLPENTALVNDIVSLRNRLVELKQRRMQIQGILDPEKFAVDQQIYTAILKLRDLQRQLATDVAARRATLTQQ